MGRQIVFHSRLAPRWSESVRRGSTFIRLDGNIGDTGPDRVSRVGKRGRMVARHDPRRDQSSKEDCLIVRRPKQKSRREHWERPVQD